VRVPAFLLVLVSDSLRVFLNRQHYCSGSNTSLVTRMVWRRSLGWRAGWFSDPAGRLKFLRRSLRESPDLKAGSRREWVRPLRRISVVVITLLAALTHTDTTAMLPPGKPVSKPAGQVWLVQTTPQFDLYSNGLRIEEQYATFTEPRRYMAFARAQSDPIASGGEWRSVPAGIVYHTTESHWAPFEENQNRSLRQAGEGLLEYVRRRHSYHFVIDRFGRIFRVVRESDFANHAGNSVWADDIWIYINLNQSFFGVAFEARSKGSGGEPAVNAAQVYAGRVLTQMLRARYDIPATKCVAHAQVSVNPANYGVGYHLDWEANLPFAELGLADNYKLPLASVKLFGFEGDAAKIETGPSSMGEGLEASIAEIRKNAAAENLPVGRYRGKLQKRYRDAIRALRGKGAYQEYN